MESCENIISESYEGISYEKVEPAGLAIKNMEFLLLEVFLGEFEKVVGCFDKYFHFPRFSDSEKS